MAKMSPLLGFKTKAGPHKGGFRRVHRHTPFTGGVYQPSASSAFNSLLIKTHRICSVWASMSVCLCRCVYMLYVIALCVCVCVDITHKKDYNFFPTQESWKLHLSCFPLSFCSQEPEWECLCVPSLCLCVWVTNPCLACNFHEQVALLPWQPSETRG